MRVKGSGDTLQTAIRSISDAVSERPIITRIEQPPVLIAKNGDTLPQQTSLDFDDPQEAVVVENGKAEDSKPKRPSVKANPKPIDVDLSAGEMPFEKLCQEKRPSTDREKYLVSIYWFKQFHNTPQIKINHILTCFLGMKWEVPKDLRTCFRAMEKDSLVKSHKGGLWEITYNGMSDINKMGGAT